MVSIMYHMIKDTVIAFGVRVLLKPVVSKVSISHERRFSHLQALQAVIYRGDGGAVTLLSLPPQIKKAIIPKAFTTCQHN